MPWTRAARRRLRAITSRRCRSGCRRSGGRCQSTASQARPVPITGRRSPSKSSSTARCSAQQPAGRRKKRSRKRHERRSRASCQLPTPNSERPMSELDEAEVYGMIGEEGFARLVRAFYAQVPSDPILGAMYPKHDLAGAEERLRDFLVGRFGGPPRYVEQRGHPRLRMRHMPFRLDEAARDRWVALMSTALDEAALPADVTSLLREFFSATATFLRNA